MTVEVKEILDGNILIFLLFCYVTFCHKDFEKMTHTIKIAFIYYFYKFINLSQS